MAGELPEYYFRVRENGAVVFHINSENRHRRLEMDQIAVINIRNGDIKPQNGYSLTDADKTAIQEWMQERKTVLALREIDDIYRAIDYLNLTTHWAHSKARDAQLEEVTEALLMAMHDLRTVLVRKKADRLQD